MHQHAALMFDSDDGLIAGALPYLREGVRRGDTVLVKVSAAAETVLRRGLGADAAAVQWTSRPDFSYRSLGGAYEGFRRYLAGQQEAGQQTRVMGEYDGQSDPRRMDQYLRYEAMSNETYAPYPSRVVCLWDGRRHSPELLRQARECHPGLMAESGGVTVDSETYRSPAECVSRPQPSLSAAPPAAPVDTVLDGLSGLGTIRHLVAQEARRAGVADVDGVVLAVNEIASNAVSYGVGPVRVRAWDEAQCLVVRVDDAGTRGISPALGYARPAPAAESGRGLWIARQMADVVTIHTDAAGTSAVLVFPAPAAAADSA